MVLRELGETLQRIEGGLSVFKPGNEDIERMARANLRGWPQHEGLHGRLGCWWLERVADLVRDGQVGATVGLAMIGSSESIALGRQFTGLWLKVWGRVGVVAEKQQVAGLWQGSG
jgi:hypothetical protein